MEQQPAQSLGKTQGLLAWSGIAANWTVRNMTRKNPQDATLPHLPRTGCLAQLSPPDATRSVVAMTSRQQHFVVLAVDGGGD